MAALLSVMLMALRLVSSPKSSFMPIAVQAFKLPIVIGGF